jgi:hypothetical protein
MADEPKPRGSGMQRAVLWLVIAALLGTVWFLASERNERHYRVATENSQLVIERGRFFPIGTAPSSEAIYAPVALPAGEKPQPELEFDDQNALDRHLFGLLGGWAKEAAKKNDTHAASILVERASSLPGLTGAQVGELSALKADLSWDDAKADVHSAAQLLDAAAGKLQTVAAAKGPRAIEAAQQSDRLRTLRSQLEPAPSPAPPAK